MKKKYFYDIPTQLKIENPDTGEWIYGIGYHDVFICACCGGAMKLDEINEDGLAIHEMSWADFSETIR